MTVGEKSLGCILSFTSVGILFFGFILAIIIGFASKATPVNPPESKYLAVYQFYETDKCELATSLPLGPCWEGEGAGYEGYYWHFTCDDKFNVYEALCGPINSGCNLTQCQRGRNWGESANECLTFSGEYYRYICINPV